MVIVEILSNPASGKFNFGRILGAYLVCIMLQMGPNLSRDTTKLHGITHTECVFIIYGGMWAKSNCFSRHIIHNMSKIQQFIDRCHSCLFRSLVLSVLMHSCCGLSDGVLWGKKSDPIHVLDYNQL